MKIMVQASSFLSGGTQTIMSANTGNTQEIWVTTPNSQFGEGTNVITASFAGVVT